MSRLQRRRGDATRPVGRGNKIICHVCNDSGIWGRGFVMAISARWPEPEADYREWHRSGSSGGFGLGALRLVQVEPDIWVANIIAQHGTRPKEGVPPIRYEHLETCLLAVANQAGEIRASIHMPRIGSGLAGGDPGKIQRIVEEALRSADVRGTIYDWD